MTIEKVLPKDKSIVLIGFMGAGKTTIGELVAKKLGRDFIDIDKEIEREFNMEIPEIFNKVGEVEFRRREKELTIKFCNEKQKVISLGGGAFQQEEIRNVCLAACTVVYLDVSWEHWHKERLPLIIDSRPLLQKLNTEEIKELFERRKGIYANHHVKFQVDEFTFEQAADHVLQLINNQSLNP